MWASHLSEAGQGAFEHHACLLAEKRLRATPDDRFAVPVRILLGAAAAYHMFGMDHHHHHHLSHKCYAPTEPTMHDEGSSCLSLGAYQIYRLHRGRPNPSLGGLGDGVPPDIVVVVWGRQPLRRGLGGMNRPKCNLPRAPLKQLTCPAKGKPRHPSPDQPMSIIGLISDRQSYEGGDN